MNRHEKIEVYHELTRKLRFIMNCKATITMWENLHLISLTLGEILRKRHLPVNVF